MNPEVPIGSDLPDISPAVFVHKIFLWKLMIILWTFLQWQKRELSPVGVEPDASRLPDEHPRLLDHRDFPICHWFITHLSDLSLATAVAHHIIYIASSAHPSCADVLQLRICRMVYHHLNNRFLRMFSLWKLIIILWTFLQWQKRELLALFVIQQDLFHFFITYFAFSFWMTLWMHLIYIHYTKCTNTLQGK